MTTKQERKAKFGTWECGNTGMQNFEREQCFTQEREGKTQDEARGTRRFFRNVSPTLPKNIKSWAQSTPLTNH